MLPQKQYVIIPTSHQKLPEWTSKCTAPHFPNTLSSWHETQNPRNKGKNVQTLLLLCVRAHFLVGSSITVSAECRRDAPPLVCLQRSVLRGGLQVLSAPHSAWLPPEYFSGEAESAEGLCVPFSQHSSALWVCFVPAQAASQVPGQS